MKFARIIEFGDTDQILIQKRYGDDDDKYDIVITVEQEGLLYDLTITNLQEKTADDMFKTITLEEIFEISKKIGIRFKNGK